MTAASTRTAPATFLLTSRPASHVSRALAAALLLAGLLRRDGLAQAVPQTKDLVALSIEELMAIDVTSASKHDERLFQVPAAVFVITREDLRRSGALSIPDALRMVPGFDVAQVDGNRWEVSARGFSAPFANKLLVLIDGRIVYTHLTAGVYWDIQDVVLEDVERIEVIRGPGATLWGANAVNGVINIITRSSRDTTGGLLTLGAGNLEKVFGTLRYGGSLGENLTYRLFSKGFSRGRNTLPDGTPGNDAWNSRRAGLRADWRSGPDEATLEGEVYRANSNERITEVTSLTPPVPTLTDQHTEAHGGFGSLLLTHHYSDLSSIAFSASYDVRMRDEVALRPHEEILDLSFQHNFALGQRNRIVWGLEYRRTTEDSPGGFVVTLTPQRDAEPLISGFVQEDFTAVENRFHVILGLKVERFDNKSPSYQPNLRLLWTPSSQQTVWASVGRALRTPARIEEGIRSVIGAVPQPDGSTALIVFFGNPGLRQEEVLAYEAGYRVAPTSTLSLDLAAFFNRYSRLLVGEGGAPFFETDPAPGHVVIPLDQNNGGSGTTHGAELAANWNPMSGLRFRPALTWLKTDLHVPPGSFQTAGEAYGGGASLQASVRTAIDLPKKFELDLNFFYVGDDPLDRVDPYTRLDLVGGWSPFASLQLSAGVEDLFDRRPLQVFVSSDGVQTTRPGRSVYGKMTWHF